MIAEAWASANATLPILPVIGGGYRIALRLYGRYVHVAAWAEPGDIALRQVSEVVWSSSVPIVQLRSSK